MLSGIGIVSLKRGVLETPFFHHGEEPTSLVLACFRIYLKEDFLKNEFLIQIF